jgi:hypothetical protein
MNRIAAIQARSRFVPEEHLVIAIDGVPLDELLDAALPGSEVAGLIPSLLGWFDDEKDRVVPWQRILPEVECSGYAPLLICPDDLDFTCVVIMAEVVAEPDVIRWDRLGYDATPAGAVGSYIQWEPAFGHYRFSRQEYEACLEAFRSADAESSAVATPAPGS